MTRNVPAALQTHLDSGTTTTTVLIKIAPVTPGYPAIGVTLLDRDVTYDDGAGSITYVAKIGMVPAAMVNSSHMDVDNTETQHMLPEFDLPISEADIAAGVYDYAEHTSYLVNYEDLTAGRHVVLGYGPVGQMRIENGLSFWVEQTGLGKLLKTNLVEKDSITCRATFGSQPIGTGGGVVEEKFPCGFDAETLYVAGTVTSVGLETNRTFTDSGLGAAADAYVPGMMRWLTGDNTGRQYEVESQSGAGVISLGFETMFPVVIGDTFEIRPDCTKWKEGPNGCKTFWLTDWTEHYRGEPNIPIADADAINMPGATVGQSLGGS